MAPAHTSWIMEPTKMGFAVPGSDARALMSSSRVRNARRQQQRQRPSTADAFLSSAHIRAREVCLSPLDMARIPAIAAPTTANSFASLNAAGRHALPRPLTSGGTNLGHGLRHAPISAMQPHVHTDAYRIGDSRDTVVRNVHTPSTNRRREERLANGHRLSSKTSSALLASSSLSDAIGLRAAPQRVDLSYVSVGRDGEHWSEATRLQPVRGKSYVLIHEAGMKRVILEDLLWGGAPQKDTPSRATVYNEDEPGYVTFRREWDSTFGRTGRLPPSLLVATSETREHEAFRTATFDGRLEFATRRPASASPGSISAREQMLAVNAAPAGTPPAPLSRPSSAMSNPRPAAWQ